MSVGGDFPGTRLLQRDKKSSYEVIFKPLDGLILQDPVGISETGSDLK